MTERINYKIENGQYIGFSVNLPLVVQSDSYDKMVEGITTLARHYINDLKEALDKNTLLEFKEVEDLAKL